jgi:hypothetical protein
MLIAQAARAARGFRRLFSHYAQAPAVLDHSRTLAQRDRSAGPTLAGGEKGGECNLIFLYAGGLTARFSRLSARLALSARGRAGTTLPLRAPPRLRHAPRHQAEQGQRARGWARKHIDALRLRLLDEAHLLQLQFDNARLQPGDSASRRASNPFPLLNQASAVLYCAT